MSWDREKERKAGKAVGIGGSIYGIVFMLIWCGLAAAMGAWFMLIFGLPMLGFMIFRTVAMVKKSNAEKQKEPWEHPQGSRCNFFYTNISHLKLKIFRVFSGIYISMHPYLASVYRRRALSFRS